MSNATPNTTNPTEYMIVWRYVYLQDEIEDNAALYEPVDDADLLAGDVNDLGRVILEEPSDTLDQWRHDDDTL